ncbi:MAG: 4-hydroxythreonine-4-phosphate dehydrogenase PdxA, partial [Bradymonadaceae bacterium]
MKLALTIGDVAGIGPEVLLKALREPLADDVTLFVYGDYAALRRENERLGEAGLAAETFERRFAAVDGCETTLEGDRVGVIDVAPDLEIADVDKGEGDARCARLQQRSFVRAVDDVVDERAQAVVTAPWNKSLFETIGEPIVGHTD